MNFPRNFEFRIYFREISFHQSFNKASVINPINGNWAIQRLLEYKNKIQIMEIIIYSLMSFSLIKIYKNIYFKFESIVFKTVLSVLKIQYFTE